MEKYKIRFLVGSDETPFNVPGYAFHREIQLLSNAKLSNRAILKALTVNASDAIGMSSKIGDVKVGMMADIVILNSNPLDNTANLKDINAVIKSGNYYTTEQLQDLLSKAIENDIK
jgi:imidazolonepropionase-like amidohydrolase